MVEFDRLQTGGFFACRCQRLPDKLQVGILVIDYSRHQPGSWVDLINPEGTDAFTVICPDVSCPAFNVEVLLAPF